MTQQTYSIMLLASAFLLLYFIVIITIRVIANKSYDEALRIETRGVRNWSSNNLHNRTESTPYLALNSLSKEYQINKSDGLVDFGCGKGRVAIFIYDRYEIPVTGVELDVLAHKEASENVDSYSRGNEIEIEIKNCLAEEYKIEKRENKFFFFNPFHVSTFEKVVHNIIKSADDEKKQVEIILYYPIRSYRNVLKETPFKLTQRIKARGSIGFTEKFLIYTYNPTSMKK